MPNETKMYNLPEIKTDDELKLKHLKNKSITCMLLWVLGDVKLLVLAFSHSFFINISFTGCANVKEVYISSKLCCHKRGLHVSCDIGWLYCGFEQHACTSFFFVFNQNLR